MPTTCIAPGCKTGYRSCPDKKSLFTVTLEPQRLALWSRKIPRDFSNFNFTSKTVICENHFEEKYIVRTYTHIINGEKVSMPRGRPSLTPDAVPTIFPNLPRYLSSTSSQRQPNKRQRSTSTQPSNTQRKKQTFCTESMADASDENASFDNFTLADEETIAGDELPPRPESALSTSSSLQLTQLKEEIYSLREKLQNSKKKLALANENLEAGKRLDKTNAVKLQEDIFSKLPRIQKIMINECIELSKRKSSRGHKYSPEWILQCLLMRIRMKTAYNFMRKNEFLPLPSSTTINRYMKSLDTNFGFDNNLFDLLKEKLSNEPIRNRRGILLFDEMSVRKHLEFDKHTYQMRGHCDFGEFTSESNKTTIGDHALVFLFRPFMGQWMQVVGTFCAAGATPGSVLAKLLLQCIALLENAGALVDAIVCDGAATNKSMLSQLGICGKRGKVKTKFENISNPKRHIHAIIDIPHVFKCIRNNLISSGAFEFPTGTVYHGHYCVLLSNEENLTTGLRVVPKLTKAHVAPNNFQKMNVRLATQLFSNQVADGLSLYQTYGKKYNLAESDETIKFTRFLNTLFDVLNGGTPQRCLKLNKFAHQFIKEAIVWLDNWEDYISAKYPPNTKSKPLLSRQTSESLRISLTSILELSEFMLSNGFDYVLTKKFNQDPLERFFGMVRQTSSDNHPTSLQFSYIYRLLSAYCLVKPPKKANIENAEAVQLLCKLKELKRGAKNMAMRREIEEKLDAILNHPEYMPGSENTQTEFEHNYCAPEIEDIIVTYLGGYIVRNAKQLTICPSCIASIQDQEATSRNQRLIQVKSKGYLIHPSRQLEKLLLMVEECIQPHLTKPTPNIYIQVMEDIVQNPTLPNLIVGCEDHATSLTKFVLNRFILCRLHFFTRHFNKILLSNAKSKDHRKLSTLT